MFALSSMVASKIFSKPMKKFYLSFLILLTYPLFVFSHDISNSTIITSDRLEMTQGETQNHFLFYDNVTVVSQNFKATSNLLEVFSAREEETSKSDTDMSSGAVKVGAIKKIIAIGNVVINQKGRHATAGKAIILPDEEKIILTENPVVTDDQGTVTGFRMTLLRGQNRAVVEGGPKGERSTVVLPVMPDFGFPKEQEEEGPSKPNKVLPNLDK